MAGFDPDLRHWRACYPTDTAFAHAWSSILDDSVPIVTRAVTGGLTVHGRER